MARNTKEVIIKDEGRDRGKCYFLTEMPASRAEKWAFRVFQALSRSGTELPDDIRESGMLGIARLSLAALSRMDSAEADALLDQMMECVKFVPSRENPEVMRPLVETDIEEVRTRVNLRLEVLNLHTGFTLPGVH